MPMCALYGMVRTFSRRTRQRSWQTVCSTQTKNWALHARWSYRIREYTRVGHSTEAGLNRDLVACSGLTHGTLHPPHNRAQFPCLMMRVCRVGTISTVGRKPTHVQSASLYCSVTPSHKWLWLTKNVQDVFVPFIDVFVLNDIHQWKFLCLASMTCVCVPGDKLRFEQRMNSCTKSRVFTGETLPPPSESCANSEVRAGS